jgi:hypothetical protein
MTTLCGGGSSASKPGFNANVVLTGAAIEAALVLFGVPEVAAILGPIIGPTVFELTTFCATDPPPDPVLTGADILAATNFTDPGAAITAQNRIRQWFESRYWYQVCECTSTTTPTAPAPSNPGPISTNPGIPTATTGAQCWNATQDWVYSGPFLLKQDNVLLWNDGQSIHNNSGARDLMVPPPAQTRFTGTYNPSGASQSDNVFIQIDWFDSGGSVIRTDKTGLTDSPPKHLSRSLTVTPPSGAVRVQYGAGSTGFPGTSPTGSITLQVEVWCDGQSPTNPNAPCCPPDPNVERQLDQIYGLLVAIFQSLPAPITSYADGTAHTGLTGNGTLTLVDSPLAIRINITTDNAHLGVDDGSPDFLFSRGYLVPIVNSAPIRGEARLVYNPQMMPLPALTEQVGYSLAPGVTVSVTELTAGP